VNPPAIASPQLVEDAVRGIAIPETIDP